MSSPTRVMGLDLGTTKVGAVIADIDKSGKPTIVGVGTSKCEGLRRGVIVDIEKTVAAIESAVQEAEMMTDRGPEFVYASISGDHIRGMNSTGVVAITSPGREITERDVQRVIKAARGVVVPEDRLILHVIPQQFVVDDQRGIDLPLGMTGIRLEVQAHIITCAMTCAQNVAKTVKMAGFDVNGLVLQPLATGLAVLTQEEMQLGVAVIDIGGGTTDICIFKDGAVRYSSVVALGGNNITNDLVIGLRTPFGQAEAIKIEHGQATIPDGDTQMIEVPGVQGRKMRRVSKRFISQVIKPRLEEIFDLVKAQIIKSELYDVLGAGVVLTGGTSMLTGVEEVSEEVLSLPARIGVPDNVFGLTEYVRHPRMATGVGLVHFAANSMSKGGVLRVERQGGLKGFVARIREWFGSSF